MLSIILYSFFFAITLFSSKLFQTLQTISFKNQDVFEQSNSQFEIYML